MATGQPLTPEALVYDLKTAGDPQVSPDGARVIYTLSETDREAKKGRSQIWACAIDGADSRQLTRGGERNGGGRWSPDGAWIAFVSDRPAVDKDEAHKKSGLFVMPARGAGEARELTRHSRPIGAIAWSPDGTQIAYTVSFDPDNPGEEERPADAAPRVRVTRRIDYKQDNRGYLNDRRDQIFLVDGAGGTRRQLTTAPIDHHFPQWSPDGRAIAAQVPNRNGMHAQLALIDVASGERQLVGPADGAVAVWSWSPSGDRILFAGDTRQTFQTDFFVYTVADGTTRRLTDDLQILPEAGFPTIAPPAQPVWLDDRRVLVHALRAGASGLYVVNAAGGSVEPLQRWRALHAGLSTDKAGRYVAQARSTAGETGEVSVYDARSGETKTLTGHNAALLAARPPAEPERFEVRRGPYTIEAWLLKPPGFDPAKRYPLVLDVHGGPNGFYGWGFNATQQALATAGFLVVFANPRGSSSYGREFTQQVIGDWGGEDFQDLMAVVDRVLERPYADPQRTGIYGYSYGGYMTAWTIGQTDRFRAAVCGAPCFDLESFYGTSDIGHTFSRLEFGEVPHRAPAWYAAHSPSSFAHRAVTPTLIVHGEADERCPIGQGEQLFVALQEAGCEVEFARYPGGSHLFLRVGPPEHREDFYARVRDWFKHHLGEAQ